MGPGGQILNRSINFTTGSLSFASLNRKMSENLGQTNNPNCFALHRPKSGSMLLYSRKKVRYRRDGYCWKKRKDGKTTREDHMKLKVQGTEVSVWNRFKSIGMHPKQTLHVNVLFRGFCGFCSAFTDATCTRPSYPLSIADATGCYRYGTPQIWVFLFWGSLSVINVSPTLLGSDPRTPISCWYIIWTSRIRTIIKWPS